MNSISLNMEPHQYLAGWRQDAGALFLPALSESRVGEQVVARIGLFGQPVRATVYGKVAMVRRIGRPSLPPGVEIHLDRASVPAARFLAAVASGEPVTFKVRAPRYTMQRACSIVWPGDDPPTPGELLALRFANGFLAPSTDAVVCWASGDSLEKNLGLRIVAEGRGGRAWRTLLEETSRGHVRTV
jgi:Tfp pilus assembly protein PilZ